MHGNDRSNKDSELIGKTDGLMLAPTVLASFPK